MGRAHEVRAASMAKTAAAKSKINAKFGRAIYVAAKSGIPDPDVNQALKKEIEKAKREHIPADVIKRNIEKAKGGSQESYTAITYEGFGPNNSLFIVDCLTDNNNRTYTTVRTAFDKCGCKLGVSGSVTHQFDYRAMFSFEGMSDEEAMELLLMSECDILDVEMDEDGVTSVYAQPSEYAKIKQVLSENKPDMELIVDEVTWVPQSYVTLTEEKDINHYNRLRDSLDDIDDVQTVYHNVIDNNNEE